LKEKSAALCNNEKYLLLFELRNLSVDQSVLFCGFMILLLDKMKLVSSYEDEFQFNSLSLTILISIN
jgi:hypothetical protein